MYILKWWLLYNMYFTFGGVGSKIKHSFKVRFSPYAGGPICHIKNQVMRENSVECSGILKTLRTN